jgi:hypothetical protein
VGASSGDDISAGETSPSLVDASQLDELAASLATSKLCPKARILII